MNYTKKMMEDCFFILKFLKQRNDYEKEINDFKYEDDCYYDDTFDYLF